MYTRVLLLFWLCLTLSNLPQPAWTRSLSVSLNMSMTRSELEDRNTSATSATAKLSRELLQSCMRETDVSMSQLKLFRISLLFNDNNENEFGTGNGDDDLKNSNNLGDMDYSSTAQLPYLDLKRNEPLQCFVRCLYEGLGLVHYDMMLEEAFKMELESLTQRLKPDLKECKNIDSKNRCEAAYKLHLCYNHLKNMEAEQRLREVLERSDTGNDLVSGEDNENDNDVNGTDKANDIIDGMQHFEEHEKSKN